MNKKLIDEVSKEMEKAVQEVAKKLNVKIEFDGGSYNLTEGKLKFKVTEVGEKLENSMKDEYSRYCPVFGLKEEWFGKEITFPDNGDRYKIAGIAPSRRKYPVILQSLTSDKRILVTVDYIKELLA